MQKILIIFFIYYCCPGSATAQKYSEYLKTSTFNYDIDSLNMIYGHNKHVLKEYELPSLIALSYYPELHDDFITFKYANIKSTAISTITLLSVFKKHKKHYLIFFNNNKQTTGILLSMVPLSAQVALIAHELAHLLDFKKRDFWGMASWGLSYLSSKGRTYIEKSADEMVIKRGLGSELYNWIDFVLSQSTANKRYLEMKRRKYLSPVTVLTEMKKINHK